jgi:hypothetical protein
MRCDGDLRQVDVCVHEMILLDAPIRVRERAASRQTAALTRDRVCWIQFCKIGHDPEPQRRMARARVRGSAACEEAASAENENVTRCNHDNTNVIIKR